MTVNEYLERYEKQVIHNDFDGILSGLYLYNQAKLDVAGIINYDNALSIDSTPLSNAFINSQFIFNDVATSRIASFDHHLQYSQISNCLNVNNYFNIDKPKHKMPFGNICWLMFIFRDNYKKYSLEQLQLIFLSDGFFKFALNPSFQDNILEWCTRLKLDNMIHFVESFKNDEWQELAQYWLSGEIRAIDNKYYWVTSEGDPQAAQNKINELANIFNWKPFKLPSIDYNYNLSTNRFDPRYQKPPIDCFTHYIHSNKYGRYSNIVDMEVVL